MAPGRHLLADAWQVFAVHADVSTFASICRDGVVLQMRNTRAAMQFVFYEETLMKKIVFALLPAAIAVGATRNNFV